MRAATNSQAVVKEMPVNLSEAFEGVPGIYVIGSKNPPRDGRTFWKVGMGTSLRSRLGDYQICFPEGYWIKLLLTLPTPQGRWRDDNIRRAVAIIERQIHNELDDTADVERLTIVHKQSEWFAGKFSDVRAAIARVIYRLGLQDRVRVHDKLSSVRYGPTLKQRKGRAHIPAGDNFTALQTSAMLADVQDRESWLTAQEEDAVEGMLSLQVTKNWETLGLPDTPDEAEREYVVSRIVDETQDEQGQTLYKVRWKGYRKADDTWETEANLLQNASEKVFDWKAAQGATQLQTMARRPTNVGRPPTFSVYT
jgi:hypothetical protein